MVQKHNNTFLIFNYLFTAAIATVNLVSVMGKYEKADGSVDFNSFLMTMAAIFTVKNRTAAYIAGFLSLVITQLTQIVVP